METIYTYPIFDGQTDRVTTKLLFDFKKTIYGNDCGFEVI